MVRFTLVSIWMLVFFASAQSTAPDLSGTWTMDPDRSESAHQDVPIGPITVGIRQTATEITIDTARKATPKAVATHEILVFQLNGSESVDRNPGMSLLKVKAHWEGGTLVTETTRNIQDSTITTVHTHHLEASGRDLIIEKTLTVQHGYQFEGAKTTGRGKDTFVRKKG